MNYTKFDQKNKYFILKRFYKLVKNKLDHFHLIYRKYLL